MVDFEFTHGPYPTEKMLDEIKAIKTVDEARWLMLEGLDTISETMEYLCVSREDEISDIRDKPVAMITLRTGGWSGCEDLIAALNSNIIIGMMWYFSWKRGGTFVYEVPLPKPPAKEVE